MSTKHESTLKSQDFRALPAPPLALWTFGLLLAASALWAVLHV